MVAQEEITRAQVERILHSETFRNSEALRRLMKFLCDKTLAGESDELTEYSVGIDALGKPTTYDPRQDSVVRIQVSRLRQKLAEYYRLEGKDDPAFHSHCAGTWRGRWIGTTPNSPRARCAMLYVT